MITLFAVENSAISGYNRKSDFYQEERKMAEYKLLKTEGRAKRAEFHTVHGTIQTPVL